MVSLLQRLLMREGIPGGWPQGSGDLLHLMPPPAVHTHVLPIQPMSALLSLPTRVEALLTKGPD